MNKSGIEKKVLHKYRNKGTCEHEKTRNAERFLITINILGSSGPVRFVVKMKDLVSGVIENALKYYAREGRLPVLGSDASNFLLYPANAGCDALNPLEPIGSYGARNFVLYKKKVISPKNNGGWKAWLNKSLSFKT
ncbi:hypothetical protein TanjilG_09912 [Lupinus angustifolius]|uniref:DUF7054 domain-containing protein n=1 Tax=Lupinus angustifolius TaxID=3871 RepID=A0A1J7GCZ3_LUPAN|nr:PREDICTED: uncharacterized protein At4g22758-like [Lupinus angustifolius]OIV98278.1 hypothetical protein TanjilG_09912 [Lupinus angustifolius]